MIAFGSRLYGKTHRVPGRFHVSTRFLHVSFFPIVPRSSWVVLHKELRKEAGGEAYRLTSIQWRSVFLAWARAALVTVGLILSLVLSTQILLDRPLSVLASTGGALLGAALAYWCTYRFDRTDEAHVAELLRASGIPSKVLQKTTPSLAPVRG